jgi:hypothetical protein
VSVRCVYNSVSILGVPSGFCGLGSGIVSKLSIIASARLKTTSYRPNNKGVLQTGQLETTLLGWIPKQRRNNKMDNRFKLNNSNVLCPEYDVLYHAL